MRLKWLTLIIIILFGYIIRVHHLNRPMQQDESISFLDYVRQPYSTILSLYDDPNNHILNTLFMRTMLLINGDQEMTLRLHVFFAGILLIPAVYVMGARLWDRDIGILAAGLTAASGGLIEASINARAYIFVTLIFVLLVIIAQGLLTRRSPRLWISYAILAAVGFYAIPFMILPMTVVSSWLFLKILFGFRGSARNQMLRRLFLTLGAGAALTIVLYSPILLTAHPDNRITGERSIVTLRSTPLVERIISLVRPVMQFSSQGTPRLLRYGLFVMAAIGAYVSLRQRRIPFWLLSIVVTAAVVMLLRVGTAFIRAWTWFLPIYSLTAAVGIVYVLRWLRLKQQPTIVIVTLALVVLNIANMGTNDGLLYGSSVLDLTFEVEETALYLAGIVEPDEPVLSKIQAHRALEFYLVAHNRPDIRIVLSAPTDDALPERNDRRIVVTFAEDRFFHERMWEGYQIDVNRPDLHFEPLATFGHWQVQELTLTDPPA